MDTLKLEIPQALSLEQLLRFSSYSFSIAWFTAIELNSKRPSLSSMLLPISLCQPKESFLFQFFTQF